jgi:hypothetical protein
VRADQVPNLHVESDSAPLLKTIPPFLRETSTGSLIMLAALVGLAAIVRIIATRNDLWLDELISLRIANAAKTPWQIFSGVHSDNNHYLNTLFLYWVRKRDYAPLYRYLSVACGVALVPAGYWLLARRSRVEAVILAGLLACSYPLIHFSSEARGYSGALFGCMLACAALANWMARGEGKAPSFFLGLIYGLSLSLALLSHLTACLIWFPLAAGSLITLSRRPRWVKWISWWLGLNVLPATLLAALYFLDLRFMKELGGAPMSVLYGLGRLLALGVGWPAKDAVTGWIVAGLLVALAIWQLAAEKKTDEPLALLLALIYLMPFLCALLIQPEFFSPRYFLVILPFAYAAPARLLARLVRTRLRRVALAAVLALFLAGQVHLYFNFLRVGRGHFTEALEYIVNHSPSQRVSVASNQDFRSSVELAYYAPRLLRNRQLVYVPQDSHPSFQPDWYILHEEGYQAPGPAVLDTAGDPNWYRVAYFGASELSGQAWTIYSHRPTE